MPIYTKDSAGNTVRSQDRVEFSRLIMAAPDLLAAIQKHLEAEKAHVIGGGAEANSRADDLYDEAKQMMESAVAKALGATNDNP